MESEPMGYEKMFEIDSDGYVSFGDVSRNLMKKQCQYGSYYIDGVGGRPILGEGLRITGDRDNYHSLKIHVEDIDEFIRRYKDYLKTLDLE